MASAADRVLRRVPLALLLAGAVLTAAPLLWMVAASFMPDGEANQYPPRLVPSDPTGAHYRELFTRLALGRYLVNSSIVSLSVTALALLICSMAGYAFAKLPFRGRDRVFRLLIAGLVIPVQVTMLPLFLLLKGMHLINTYWAVIIPGLASIYAIFLVRQYVSSIPDDLLDAARLDGAGELRIFWSVILPVIRPIMVTLGIYTFMTTWNDFMWPLIVLSDDRRYTLPVALANLVGEHAQDTELMMAGAVLTVLPVFLSFVVLQRYYIEGATAGSVKG